MTVLLNFGHPLAPEAAAELADVIGEFDPTSVRVQLDMTTPLAEQVRAIVDGVGFSSEDWQTKSIVVALPGASVAAALVLAELHGLTGAFPRIVSLTRAEDGVFHLAEVIDLFGVRNVARAAR